MPRRSVAPHFKPTSKAFTQRRDDTIPEFPEHYTTVSQAASQLRKSEAWVRKRIAMGQARAIPNPYFKRGFLVDLEDLREQRPRKKREMFSWVDDAFIRRHWGQMPVIAIAKRLGRDCHTVRYAATKRLGLPKVREGKERESV